MSPDLPWLGLLLALVHTIFVFHCLGLNDHRDLFQPMILCLLQRVLTYKSHRHSFEGLLVSKGRVSQVNNKFTLWELGAVF